MKPQTVKAGDNITIKIPLPAVAVTDPFGDTTGKPQAGACSLTRWSTSWLSLSNAQVDDEGALVYTFKVGGSKTPEGKLAHVQLTYANGSGQAAGPAGMGTIFNPLLYQIK